MQFAFLLPLLNVLNIFASSLWTIIKDPLVPLAHGTVSGAKVTLNILEKELLKIKKRDFFLCWNPIPFAAFSPSRSALTIPTWHWEAPTEAQRGNKRGRKERKSARLRPWQIQLQNFHSMFWICSPSVRQQANQDLPDVPLSSTALLLLLRDPALAGQMR